jgi:hypothetical protein
VRYGDSTTRLPTSPDSLLRRLKQRFLGLAGAFAILVAGPACADSLVTQTISLTSGWNAVFLEVTPQTNKAIDVFAGVPIDSVWTFIHEGQGVEFIQNVSEELVDDPFWLVFFPTNRIEAKFNDLARIVGDTPYFIKLPAGTSYTWNVTGSPAVPRYDWNPEYFNLVGFFINPVPPRPTAANFFAHSPVLSGQAIYRLDANGVWQLVASPQSEQLREGEAIWVFASGETDYMGPLHVTIDQNAGMDFGGSLDELSVYLENRSLTNSTTVTIEDLSPGGTEFSYWTFDTNVDEVVWLDLPDPLTVTIGTGVTHRLRLAVNRGAISGDSYDTVLQVISDTGMRVRLPVTARKELSGP